MKRAQAVPIARVIWPQIAYAYSLSGRVCASTIVAGAGGGRVTRWAPTEDVARELVREAAAALLDGQSEQGTLL